MRSPRSPQRGKTEDDTGGGGKTELLEAVPVPKTDHGAEFYGRRPACAAYLQEGGTPGKGRSAEDYPGIPGQGAKGFQKAGVAVQIHHHLRDRKAGSHPLAYDLQQ